MEFLNNNFDAILALVTAVVGVVWTFVKGTDFYKGILEDINRKGFSRAWTFALQVVQEQYETVVRAAKKEGRFSDELKNQVKQEAVDKLKARLADDGIKLAQELLPTLVEQGVNYLKGKGKAASEGKVTGFLPGPELG